MKSLRIGALDYTVEEYDRDHVSDTDKLGQHLATDQVIKYYKSGDTSKDFVTVLHEVMHGIVWSYGLDTTTDIDPKQEESYINVLALGVFAALRDNPALRALLQKALRAADSREL